MNERISLCPTPRQARVEPSLELLSLPRGGSASLLPMASNRGARTALKWVSPCALCAVAACGGARPEALAPCHFAAERTTLDSVNVSVPRHRFALGLKDVPATIELVEDEPDARLRVTSPLRFTATYPQGKLPLLVAASTDLFEGRIRLGLGAKPDWLDVRGDGIRLSTQRTLSVAVKQPLTMDCGHLGLSDGRANSSAHLALGSGERIGTGGDFVPFYVQPEGGAPIDIRYPGAWVLRARRPGWARLEATWSDGSQVTGWIPEHYTTDSFEGQVVPSEQWVGKRCGWADAPPLDKVTVRAGAAIATSAAGPVWAYVTRDIEVDALAGSSHDWIQVGALPGLVSLPEGCSHHQHVWVHSRDVAPAMP